MSDDLQGVPRPRRASSCAIRRAGCCCSASTPRIVRRSGARRAAVDPGESYEAAARRELLEETGITADPGPQIARKLAEFITIEGVPVLADERYFRVQLPAGFAPEAIDTGGHTELERQVMRSWRWFEREELGTWDEAIFPEDLGTLLGQSPLLTG
jgi:8-oxo-dGTP diphosphatase